MKGKTLALGDLEGRDPVVGNIGKAILEEIGSAKELEVGSLGEPTLEHECPGHLA